MKLMFVSAYKYAVLCRYCINYAPFDFVYKLCKFMPIRLVISILKECQRANKVHHGVAFAIQNFPGSHLVVGVFGILKGLFRISSFSFGHRRAPVKEGTLLVRRQFIDGEQFKMSG